MSMIDKHVDWCLSKAAKELKEGPKHRGLVKIKPDLKLARQHIKKAEHNLRAVTDFRKIGFGDWSASAAFYSIYHSLLAILVKHGFESRNQACTFSVINQLIDKGQIKLDKDLVDEVSELSAEESQEDPSIIDVRESQQYGVSLSIENKTFNKLLTTAKLILDKTKEIIEE